MKEYFEPKGGHNAVYNLGIPGEDSIGLLKRIDTECGARISFKWPEDKYVISVAIGTNDCKLEKNKPRIEIKKFEKNINELINKTKSYKAKVVFIGLFPVDEKLTLSYENTSFSNERIKLFNDIIKKSCEKNNILFLNMFETAIKEDYVKLLDDGLHPNSKGYDFMFDKVRNFFEKMKLFN